MKRIARWALTLLALWGAGAFLPTAEGHFYAGCKKDKCKWHVVAPHNSHLDRIAHCESRQRWHLNTGNGFYGGLQFTAGTWRATGSSYSRADYAPVLEQKYRAVVWASRIGWAWHSTAGWPVCG